MRCMMLEPLLESEKKEKILLYLYTNGEAYPREIAKAFRFYINTVQNQMLNLEMGGGSLQPAQRESSSVWNKSKISF